MITERLEVVLSFDVCFKQTPNDWWEAWNGKLGSTSAKTKEECIRILKERAKE